jgi:hypothetical protein
MIYTTYTYHGGGCGLGDLQHFVAVVYAVEDIN